MNPIIDGKLVVPVHPERENYKNIACALFNVSTGEYLHAPLGNDFAKQVKESSKGMKGTVLYIHSKYNVFGIIKDSKKAEKPILYWLRGEEVDLIKDELINYNERLNIIDIHDKPIEIFKGRYRTDLFSNTRITNHKIGTLISYENFIESLVEVNKPTPVVQGGQSSIVIEVAVEDDEEAIVNDEETAVEDGMEHNYFDEEHNEEVNENIMNTYKNNSYNEEPALDKEKQQYKSDYKTKELNSELVKALIEATNSMNETMVELKKTTESYKESMAKSFGDFDLDVETKFVGVADIKGSLEDAKGESIESSEVGLDSVYEFILKIMKVDDSISLPRTYYEKLTTVIKRNMLLSRDGNKYDSIVLIRFAKATRESLIARVEYDLAKDYTRVTIIKQFNATELTDKQLLDYEIKFNQWRRMHSYRTSD